jgi:hypothetical protein
MTTRFSTIALTQLAAPQVIDALSCARVAGMAARFHASSWSAQQTS